MIKKSDLIKNEFMQLLTDEMLEKIIAITKEREVESREIIFNEGEPAEYFYLVKSGQILLEQKISKSISVNVSAIEPGEAFGLSVLLHNDLRSMAAICNEAGTLLAMHKDDLIGLMEQDNSIGFLIMKHAAKVLHRRWVKRTDQFLRSLKGHPDISVLDAMKE